MLAFRGTMCKKHRFGQHMCHICLSIYVAFLYRVHSQSFSIRSILNAIDYVVDCKK